ncbi:MAG TPA: hypothetical protein VMV32_00265 [Ignavibacteriaceae bacterium]|nr:hypothetical protein [Ignavibacteriaceae bacterium]
MSEILSQPTPSYRYSVIAGDRLSSISSTAYGVQDYWKDIVSANPFLNDRHLQEDGSPTLYPGDILIIPEIIDTEPELENKLTGKAIDDLTIIIGDREIKVFYDSFLRTMDTGADGLKCSTAWTPGLDKELDELYLPFKFPKTEVYIGNDLQLTGYLYKVSPALSNSGSVIDLTIFSLTKDAVDSTVNPPYEKNNITLENRAKELLQPLGIRAVFEIDTGGQFDRITANQSDTIFRHLSELSAQRNCLVSCTEKGELLFYQPDTESEPVGTLKEGENFALSFAADYDGTKLFHTYRAVADTPGGDAQSSTAIDDNVPVSRSITFQANDTTDGNIGKAAEHKRSKNYIDALTIPITVSGWIAPNGKIWEKNKTVILESPTLFLPNGVKMMINQIEYILQDSGLSAVLSLIPVNVYNGEPIEYIWSVS